MQKTAPRKYILLIAALLFSAGSLFSQASLLGKKISITFNNITIEKALQQIEKTSGARFSYQSDILEVDSRVSLAVRERSLAKVLPMLLGKNYYFKTSGRYIIILKKINRQETSSSPKPFTVNGLVTDVQSGRPLATATVYDMAGLASCLTDSMGRFRLSLTPITTALALRCCKEGYADSVASLNPALNQNIVFQLNPTEKPVTKLTSVTAKSIEAEDSVHYSLVRRIVANDLLINSRNVVIKDKRLAQFSLVPKVGSNQLLGGSVVNHISFNLLGGYSKGVSGFEAGGLININKENVNGFQFSGLVNITGRDVTGFQAAGAVNYCVGDVRGVQLSPLVNISRGKVKGAQLAGLVNYAPHAGFQFGLLNIADSSEGIPMGVINIIRHGYYAFSLSLDETMTSSLLFSMGSRRLYSIIGLSNPPDLEYNSWGICYGLGSHFLYGHRLSVNVEFLSSVINAFGNFDATTISRVGLSGQLSVRIYKGIYLSAGPNFNTLISAADNAEVDAYISGAISGKSYHYSSVSTQFDAWVGFTGGMRIVLK